MPTTIEATYRVVTPMFCSGANQTKAELRLPSFKGVLRFWWRALAWSRCKGDIEEVGKQEDKLFGSASTGQSCMSMRLEIKHEPSEVSRGSVLTVSAQNRHTVGEGARYLGYGVMAAFASHKQGIRAGELSRPCLRPSPKTPFEFTVRLRGRCGAGQVDSLLDGLKAVGLLGSMGSKARKGYGSLALHALHVDGMSHWAPPQSGTELARVVSALQRRHAHDISAPFTALCSKTRHLLISSDRDEPLAILDLIGRELVRFRSWGHNGYVLGHIRSERNFRHDHNLMKSRSRKSHPERIAFGLPHNYGKRREDQVAPDAKWDRRASPLFIHVHECDGGTFAVLSFFPNQYLPKSKDGRSYISVGGTRIAQAPEAELYRPINDFLDRIQDPGRCKEPLKAQEIGP